VRRVILLALLPMLLAQEPASPAAAPISQERAAETAIEKGRLLIRDLYEEKALVVLEPYLDDQSLKPSLRGRALVYAGIAQMNLGDEAKARELFARAVETDIGAVLPEWVSRKVRVAFQLELDRVMALVNPPLPPVLTRAQRRPWAGPAFLAGAAVGAAISVFGYVRWSDYWAQYKQTPGAYDALARYNAGVPYYVLGDVAAGLGAALVAAAVWWWLWPG
jgi:hypothetical protein